MNITQSSAKIQYPYPIDGINMLRRIEYIARISHGSEESQTLDSWDRFIRSVVLDHGDWSVTEHEIVRVLFKVDRGITHELVRHRIGAYTQSSTRFINFSKKENQMEFITPPEGASGSWHHAINTCVNEYKTQLHHGISPQIARDVLPNALASTIAVTFNLRMWRHFFLMRTSKEAHPKMKQVTIPLLQDFQKNIPILFEDIVPENRQIDNLRKGR